MASSGKSFYFALTCLLLSGMVCGQNSTTFPTITNPYEQCGRINEPGFRIIGGKDVAEEQYPFVARIEVSLAKVTVQCMGSIISTRHVITVAHCLTGISSNRGAAVDPSYVTVYTGSPIRSTSITHDVEKITLHNEFDSYRLNSDIAILRLSDEIVLNPFESTVCLNENSTVESGKQCQVIGFGQADRNVRRFSERLQVAVDPMLNHSDCMTLFGSRDSDRFFCGAGGSSNFCLGDSGAPYVCEQSGRWYMYGLAAAHKDNTCTKPGKYTRVAYFNQWIEDNMN